MSEKLLNFKNHKKPELKIINKGSTVSEILLYGAIGESFWEDSISAKQFHDELKKLPESTKEIHLRVNSPGGSVFDGMAIFEHIKAERKKGRKVVAYIDGLAASIASVIIQAADEVIVGEGALVMIHKPLVGVYGNSFEHERVISILDKIEEQMITIYAKKSGKSRAEIANELAAETWFTADKAVEEGYADKKAEAHEDLQIAACLMVRDCPWMKNKPDMKTKNDLVREKLRDFNNKAKSFLDSKK